MGCFCLCSLAILIFWERGKTPGCDVLGRRLLTPGLETVTTVTFSVLSLCFSSPFLRIRDTCAGWRAGDPQNQDGVWAWFDSFPHTSGNLGGLSFLPHPPNFGPRHLMQANFPLGVSELQLTAKPLLAGLLPCPAPCSLWQQLNLEDRAWSGSGERAGLQITSAVHQLFIATLCQQPHQKPVARQACSQTPRRQVPRICHLISPSFCSCWLPRVGDPSLWPGLPPPS